MEKTKPVIVDETEILQATAKSKKGKYWKKQIISIDEDYYTRSVYWQDDSVVQYSEPKKIEKKNVGRSNETSELEQARLEVESEFNRQLDKGYSMSGERSLKSNFLLPMLAQDYMKHQAKLPEQVIVEPKLDGTRCLTDGVKFWTRKGKPYIPEIAAKFSFEPRDGLILDGELILPAPYTFQSTVSAVKKYSELTDKLEYWVYDVVDLSGKLTTLERKALLVFDTPNMFVLPFKLVNKAKVFDAHKRYVELGYEGTMIRNTQSIYEINHRSYGLLKLKDFETDEFEIIDVVDGKAKEKGLAIFVCKTKSGEMFNCRPEGEVSYREEIFQNSKDWIGKSLTVRYQGLTKDRLVPRFPVGLVVRDYE
jgi:ATP-dependent DNA ligase